jgi:hypothetical protein
MVRTLRVPSQGDISGMGNVGTDDIFSAIGRALTVPFQQLCNQVFLRSALSHPMEPRNIMMQIRHHRVKTGTDTPPFFFRHSRRRRFKYGYTGQLKAYNTSTMRASHTETLKGYVSSPER